MRLIDLTQVIAPNMPVYPDTAPPIFNFACTLEKHGFREIELTLFTHTGTHLDAPAHLVPEGATLEELPLDNFYGKAIVLDCRELEAGSKISLDLLIPKLEEIEGVEFVLIHTGWSEKWGTDDYFTGFPSLSVELAEALIPYGIKGVGIDTISVDPVGEKLKVHDILLGNNIVIVENLTNLQEIKQDSFMFSCLPLKIQQGDGSPIRAMAIEE